MVLSFDIVLIFFPFLVKRIETDIYIILLAKVSGVDEGRRVNFM